MADKIIIHMNKDHADAVLNYAKHYGKLSLANAATIVAIDFDGTSTQTAAEEERAAQAGRQASAVGKLIGVGCLPGRAGAVGDHGVGLFSCHGARGLQEAAQGTY